MINSNDQYLSNSLQYVFKSEIGQRANYTVNTGTVVISTANSNLDGTGTTGIIISGTGTNGTIVKTITIKAIGTTTRGMVRIFNENRVTGDIDCIAEVEIPAIIPSSVDEAFYTCLEVDFHLTGSHRFRASTQNAESFIVSGEGLNLDYP